MRKQIRLSGSGGQGVITAAIIYAEAAVSAGMELYSLSPMDQRLVAVLPNPRLLLMIATLSFIPM